MSDVHCVNRCGRPAVTDRLSGMMHDTPVLELLCSICADPRRKAEYVLNARPWTLNLERREHWSKARSLTREWREQFGWLGLQNRQRFARVEVVCEVICAKPLPDTGNAYGALKAAIDGLVDAGVLPGDGPDLIAALTMLAPRVPYPGDPDCLRVTLIEA
jgi:hypothetical protein